MDGLGTVTVTVMVYFCFVFVLTAGRWSLVVGKGIHLSY